MTSCPQPTQRVDFNPPYSLTVRPTRLVGRAFGSATEDISSSPRLRSPRRRSRRREGSRRNGGWNAASKRRRQAPSATGRTSARRGSVDDVDAVVRREKRGDLAGRRKRPQAEIVDLHALAREEHPRLFHQIGRASW